MALTVNQAFDELLRRLELNQTRIDLASQRYAAVKSQLEGALPGKVVRQIGSFQRKTKIRPVAANGAWDIDATVCFGDATTYASDGNGTTPEKALAQVRAALVDNETYKVMAPVRDAPTVVLEYADQFKIELVPCFRELTGKFPRANGPAAYIVPTPHGNWAPADYDFDAQVISSLNQGTAAGNLVPAIKLVKGFVRAQALPLKSFHVEVLCVAVVPDLIRRWTHAGIAWQMPHLFAYTLTAIASLLATAMSLPGSHSAPTDSGLSTDERARCATVLEKYGECARNALELEGAVGIVDLWKQIYGEPFPAG